MGSHGRGSGLVVRRKCILSKKSDVSCWASSFFPLSLCAMEGVQVPRIVKAFYLNNLPSLGRI